MRLGANPDRPLSPGLSGPVTLQYSPVTCASIQSSPWNLLVSSSQVWLLCDLIRYDVVHGSGGTFLNPSKNSNFSNTEINDSEVIDSYTAQQSRITASAALHTVIINAKINNTKKTNNINGLNNNSNISIQIQIGNITTTNASYKDIKEAIIILCSEYELLKRLELLALESIESASLISEICSWEEVGFTDTSISFMKTLLGLLQSPKVALQRIAIHIIYNAIYLHNGRDKNIFVSQLPRNIISNVMKNFIGCCLSKIRTGPGMGMGSAGTGK